MIFYGVFANSSPMYLGFRRTGKTYEFRAGRFFFSDLPGDVVGGPWGYLELWESYPKIQGGPGT